MMVGRGAKKKGVKYYGPYSHAWAIRDTVDTLLRVFPMRSCSNGVFKRSGQIGRPCLLGYIDKCSAPCVGRVDADEHRADRRGLRRLHGRPHRRVRQAHPEADVRRLGGPGLRAGRAPARRPRRTPQGAGEAGGRLRRRHRRRRDRARRGPARGRGADLPRPRRADPWPARLGRRPGRGPRHRRAGRASSCSSSTPARTATRSRGRSWCRRCPRTPTPSSSCSSESRGSRVSIRVPQRGDKRALQETVAQNAAQSLALHKTKRASDLTVRSQALEEIQEALELPTAPLRIECYDISNLQGTEVVASMVVFEDGLPRKSEYRRFVIRGVDGQNDVASMHEVITRRFRRLLDERIDSPDLERRRGRPGGPRPDAGRPRHRPAAQVRLHPGLVVVDGGPPQVAAAQRALDELGIDDVPLVRAGQAARGGLAARRGRPGDPAAHQRGPLPAAAHPRRGPPLRDHPPPRRGAPRRWWRACSTTSPGSARCGARR